MAFGLVFFLFAAKYYISMLVVLLSRGEREERGENQSGNRNYQCRHADKVLRHFNSTRNENDQEYRKSGPFVSIHLPFYNEKNVAGRMLEACSNLDYKNYEVVVVDDSKGETIEILKKWSGRRGLPVMKFVHRRDRQGFKGGALGEALRHTDPRAAYVVVFDADFIPPPDIIQHLLWYFEALDYRKESGLANDGNRGNCDNGLADSLNDQGSREASIIEEIKAWHERRRIAAVQGYQFHCLNKDENWLTKGVRVEYSGSYMIERVAEEFFGAMKMIAGSVFVVKADILRRFGWSTSLTEDWELTIRLYLEGYKVVYTPLVQAACEIPSTLQSLIRQRMRWAEGHTFTVKKYFWRVLDSPIISLREKLEFLYFAPYYLQSLFFLVGTSLWVLSELFARQYPLGAYRYMPFWTGVWGWSLVIGNLISLPLMGLTGLFMERSARRDFAGIFCFIVVSYVLAPFQAYAALKGLLEKREGTWFRTPKTGKVTELILKVHLRKVFRWVLPGRRRARPKDENKG